MKLLFLGLVFFNLFVNQQIQASQVMHPAPGDTLRFPEDWLGFYTGRLNIYDARGLLQYVDMSLDLAKTEKQDVFKWSIFYGDEERAYEMVVKDKAKGWYIIDEKNTIQLESYLLNGKLWCSFSVQGTMLVCTYEKVKNKMIFEIMAGADQPVSTTGDTEFEGEQIPAVKTFPVTTSQRAVLKKSKRKI